jgi:hypothetical protein
MTLFGRTMKRGRAQRVHEKCRGVLILLLGLFTAGWGCGAPKRPAAQTPARSARPGVVSNAQSPNTPAGDFAEYVDAQERIRVLLLPGGAARVDFARPDDRERPVHSFVLPASGREVERLIRVLDTIDGPAVTERNPTADAEYGRFSTAAFRSRRAGRERILDFGPDQRTRIGVVDGVAREFETVSLAELALAVDYSHAAERARDSGDADAAIRHYNDALESYLHWLVARGARYGIDHEPLAPQAEDVVDFPIRLSRAVYDGLAAKLRATPNADRKAVALDAVRQSWSDLAAISLDTGDGAIRVSLVLNPGETPDGGRSGIAAKVPDAVARDLLAPGRDPVWPVGIGVEGMIDLNRGR